VDSYEKCYLKLLYKTKWKNCQ